jgi:hypothetical protein
MVLASAPAGLGQGSVDAHVAELLPVVMPPGRKDSRATLDRFRVGPILWDTGEERGGYLGAAGDLAQEWANGKQESETHAFLEGLELTSPLLDSPAEDGIVPTVFEHLFTKPFAKFNLRGPDNDFDTLFKEGHELGFLATQNTVQTMLHQSVDCPPIEGSALPQSYDYPGLNGPAGLANAVFALDADIKLTQNIGFVNNRIFPLGQEDWNSAFPLLTKHDPSVGPVSNLPCLFEDQSPPCHDLTPASYSITWNPLYEDGVLGTPQPKDFAQVPPSPLHPLAALALVDTIRERVQAPFPPGLVAYHTIRGEYLTKGDRGLLANENVPDPDCGDAECDEPLGTAADYLCCLSNTDYSWASFVHFQAWLAREYDCDMEALSMAWDDDSLQGTECADFLANPGLDPLLTDDVGDLDGKFADWERFQREQHVETEDFQYRAAKASAPLEPMFTLQFNVDGFDRGCLRSDGLASGNWYTDNLERLSILTPQKKRALHAVTYGESLNFSLFGMPRIADKIGANFEPCAQSIPAGAPATFQPPCWDVAFTDRTLQEFMALGVDSLGLGYWENITLWTQVGGDFAGGQDSWSALGQAPTTETSYWTLRGGEFDPGAPGSTLLDHVTSETALWRTRRAFMTPWRSPLLVHVGASGNPGVRGELTEAYGQVDPADIDPLHPEPLAGWCDQVIDQLGLDQVQYAPFADRDGFGDLWAMSNRDVLLSPFVPDLDEALLKLYLEGADEHGWTTVVLTDVATLFELAGSPELRYVAHEVLPIPGGELGYYVLIESPRGELHEIWAIPLDSNEGAAFVQASLPSLTQHLDNLSGSSIRPVTVEGGSQGSRFDVTVMQDGLGLLLNIANVSGDLHDVQTVELQVHAPAGGAVKSWPSVPLSSLGMGDDEGGFLESRLVYIPADVEFADGSTPSEIPLADLSTAVEDARARIDDREAEGFDVAAARELLGELDAILMEAEIWAPHKVLAGLARLNRMPLLRVLPGTLTLEAVRSNKRPVRGASVQLEFPLQGHARRDLGGVTSPLGQIALICTPVSGAEVWDFVGQQYTQDGGDPTGLGVRVMKVGLLDPAYGTMAELTIDITKLPGCGS